MWEPKVGSTCNRGLGEPVLNHSRARPVDPALPYCLPTLEYSTQNHFNWAQEKISMLETMPEGCVYSSGLTRILNSGIIITIAAVMMLMSKNKFITSSTSGG